GAPASAVAASAAITRALNLIGRLLIVARPSQHEDLSTFPAGTDSPPLPQSAVLHYLGSHGPDRARHPRSPVRWSRPRPRLPARLRRGAVVAVRLDPGDRRPALFSRTRGQAARRAGRQRRLA